MVLDVSLKGALFNADNVFVAAPLHMCSLDLFHAGQPGFCTATALVSYQRGSLVGLEFVNLSDAARKLLTQVVEMNLAVDTLLERDLSEMLDTPGRC